MAAKLASYSVPVEGLWWWCGGAFSKTMRREFCAKWAREEEEECKPTATSKQRGISF